MKEELRKKYKELRKKLKDKEKLDNLICENLLNSEIYERAKLILAYYPIEGEVNILPIIDNALKESKRVALPVCLDKKGKMVFYMIESLEDVIEGLFGIKEPNKEKCILVNDFSNSICIVPGLAFDKFGNRLGYGKGYYDQFLSHYYESSIGVSYEFLLCNELPINEHDKVVTHICTEKRLIKLRK